MEGSKLDRIKNRPEFLKSATQKIPVLTRCSIFAKVSIGSFRWREKGNVVPRSESDQECDWIFEISDSKHSFRYFVQYFSGNSRESLWSWEKSNLVPESRLDWCYSIHAYETWLKRFEISKTSSSFVSIILQNSARLIQVISNFSIAELNSKNHLDISILNIDSSSNFS